MVRTDRPSKSPVAAAKRSLADLGRVLLYLGTFFTLVVTLTTLLRSWFGLELLPYFEDTFESLRDFLHDIMNILVFTWVLGAIERAIWALTYLLSLISSIHPIRLNIGVPSWVSDLSVLSVVLTRVFQNTDYIVTRYERENAEVKTTKEEWGAIAAAEGRFWGGAHHVLELLNRGYWAIVNAFEWLPGLFMRRVKPLGRQIGILIAGSLMWGYIRLGGYLINVFATMSLASPIMVVRRRMLFYFAANLVGALLACAIFFVINGYLIDYVS